jgi:hypothetical protein
MLQFTHTTFLKNEYLSVDRYIYYICHFFFKSILDLRWGDWEDYISRPARAKMWDPTWKITEAKNDWRCGSRHEVLSSNVSTREKKFFRIAIVPRIKSRSLFNFIFFRVGYQTQGLVHGRQAVWHWASSPAQNLGLYHDLWSPTWSGLPIIFHLRQLLPFQYSLVLLTFSVSITNQVLCVLCTHGAYFLPKIVFLLFFCFFVLFKS